MMDYRIVRLDESHFKSTAVLEALCFSHPWSEEALKTLTGEDAVGFAAIADDGTVVAYAGMIIAADNGDITDVATHPNYRRQGLAKAVMEKLFEFSREKELTSIALEVRTLNDAAVALYKSLGFGIAGKRPRFYRDPPDDAFVMVKQL